MFCQKSLHNSCIMGTRIDADSLICLFSHCEDDGHTVHALSQWRLTADLLALWESDCSQMCSKVSSDWLPSYIIAMRSVLKIFKMAGYRPHTLAKNNNSGCSLTASKSVQSSLLSNYLENGRGYEHAVLSIKNVFFIFFSTTFLFKNIFTLINI